jgi:uncharacterized protein YjiS (DUF1127 family)
VNQINAACAGAELGECQETAAGREVSSAATARALFRSLLKALEATVSLLARWHDRRRGRRMLMEMDAHLLKDIGISRADAYREWRKPFWRA